MLTQNNHRYFQSIKNADIISCLLFPLSTLTTVYSRVKDSQSEEMEMPNQTLEFYNL